MLTQTATHFYQSSLLRGVPGITHGFSLRHHGDMRIEKNRIQFLQLLSLSHPHLIMGEQVHGTNVGLVAVSSISPILGVDGLMVRRDEGKTGGLGVGVIVADCVPILISAADGTCVAAIHAGWKGTMGNIVGAAVKTMMSNGIEPRDIVAAIGPHIGMCCYDIPEDRAHQFQSLFKNDDRAVNKNNGKWYADIGYMNLQQLCRAGVPKENIDFAIMCTSCQTDILYSYRKDSKQTFGEILSVISFGGSHEK